MSKNSAFYYLIPACGRQALSFSPLPVLRTPLSGVREEKDKREFLEILYTDRGSRKR